MAYTTIKISPTKLMDVLRKKHLSKADFERMLEEGSRESVLKWTDEKRPVVGVTPSYFRDILKKLEIDASAIEVGEESPAHKARTLATLAAAAKAAGLTSEEVIEHFKKISAAPKRQSEMEAIAAAAAEHVQKQKSPPPRKAKAG